MQFLHADGRLIKNEEGREVLLQGYGLGNWMVQEGFLFGSCEFMAGGMRPFMRQEGMDGGRSIDQTIIECCGRSYASSFWKKFYENYFGEEDVKDLAGRGVNSVRIPLNARVLLEEEPGIQWNEDGFAALTKVVDLCETYGLYTILDLHAAAGGQSAIGCDDGWDNQPHLFTDEESWERTIVLWEELARRFKDRASVAGYELLNEPLSLPVTDPLLPRLAEFYEECISRIRKIDRRHIIFLQGHRFASRADIFLNPVYIPAKSAAAGLTAPGEWVDPECGNWVLTYHMYETLPDLGSLGHIFAESGELNVPVWMGETGGSSEYMTVLYEMLREMHIGINVWCHKGEESSDAAWLCSFKTPKEFDLIRKYAREGGPKPSYEHAIRIFDEYLENIRFENCEKHGGRTCAILRKAPLPTDSAEREERVLTVPATGYDLLPGRDLTKEGDGEGSFFGREQYASFTGYRREDHMRVVCEPDFVPYESAAFAWTGGRAPKYGDWPHLELALDEGEYASYMLRQIETDTELILTLRTKAAAELEIGIRNATLHLSVPCTNGKLKEVCAGTVPAGPDTSVRIRCASGGVTLREICFRR